MFQVNRSENRLQKLEEKRFSDLNLREREHLQEWLANQPDALGEELLIIQKEFDGFADTRERLDLLALDKDGQLVVIENKLDDSGRDVAWQALKYTAYVSSLTKTQIIDIYQQYLERYCGGGNAAGQICEFLEVEELDEVVLNPGNDQRLIFVAANFRKEVTSTVLWLRGNGIDARCFRVTPFEHSKEILIDVRPVIPTPEAEDFMIKMAEKGIEERQAQGAQQKAEQLKLKYWQQLSPMLAKTEGHSFREMVPPNRYYISSKSPIARCRYALVVLKSQIRIELVIETADAERNLWIHEELCKRSQEIENVFGGEIEWAPKISGGSKKIQSAFTFQLNDIETWEEALDWHLKGIVAWEKALQGPMSELNQGFKSGENLI
jgi:hypothetical protein